eukprot:GHVU01055257.1.p1 GENE.GHVU01055257.1~~GHVU01055257.1.p1  ORF type:complete len:114 (-),score=7.49 GHVU01055257.1:79-420(-)
MEERHEAENMLENKLETASALLSLPVPFFPFLYFRVAPPPPFFPVFFSPGPIANSQHPALGDDERPLPFVRAAGGECYEVFIDSRFMTSWGGTTRDKWDNLCIYHSPLYIAVP